LAQASTHSALEVERHPARTSSGLADFGQSWVKTALAMALESDFA
jgi:hypothetical protein